MKSNNNLESIKQIMKRRKSKNVRTDNVNNVKESLNNVNNVENARNYSREELLDLLLGKFSNERERKEYLANELARKLGDEENLNCHRSLVKEHKEKFLFECLSITEDAWKRGKIKGKKAPYFMGVIKRRQAKYGKWGKSR